ncbi:MAG: PilW family protein [Chromatiaceae bacterium]
MALAIGLVLVAGVATVAVNTGQSHRKLNQVSEHLENGRYAIEVLREDLRHAGYFGELYELPGLPAALPDPCDTDTDTVIATAIAGLPLAVQGYNSPLTSAATTCFNNPNVFSPGTDVLVLRRASTAPEDRDSEGKPQPKPGRLYLQARGRAFALGFCSSESACTGTDQYGKPRANEQQDTLFSLMEKDGITLADIRAMEIHIYFIRPWTENPGDGIPTLARVILTDGGTAPGVTTEPLVSGIENMQIQYGLDNGASGGTPNDGAPDEYVTNPSGIADWANVVAVRVNLLVRQTAATGGYTDATIYDLGEGGITPGGTYQRHVFSTVVRLVNVGGRRET